MEEIAAALINGILKLRSAWKFIDIGQSRRDGDEHEKSINMVNIICPIYLCIVNKTESRNYSRWGRKINDVY